MSSAISKPTLWRVGVIAFIAGWLVLWLVPSRYAMLDDCFIHLRYADFLVKTHTITYDGIHRSFGTSSPLYVVALALLRRAIPGPMLPKILSVFLYLVLVSLLVGFCLRPVKSTLSRTLLCMLTFCLLCPMGIRWLTDGMETSFQILMILLLAWITDSEMFTASRSPLRIAGLICFGFLLTTLRIESFTLIFLAVITIYYARERQYASVNKFQLLLHSIPLAVGSILALLTIRLTLGNFLPDTAVAKSGEASINPLLGLGHLVLNSLNLGIGILLIWIVSTIFVTRAAVSAPRQHLPLMSVFAANAIFPLVAALSCLRGQMMQGIRYVLWCLVFSAVWNITQLSRMPTQNLPLRQGLASAFRQPFRAVTLVAMFLVLVLPIEAYWVYPAMVGRGATFTQMRAAPLDYLHRDRIMAADVGYIAYFSGAAICDVEGLVDGRSFAAETKNQRIHDCASTSPDALFLNDFQLGEASRFIDLSQWSVCRTFDFMFISKVEPHYLMVPRVGATSKCESLGGTPSAYQPKSPHPFVTRVSGLPHL